MTDTDKMEMRAALMQLEKTLEVERACVIRIRKVLERGLGIEHFEESRGTIIPNASIAGAVGPTATT